MGGNKGGNSTSTVTIPPEVLARYNAVNANAEKVAATPFQSYTGQFVAPLTSTQMAGIANTNTAANQAQPYFQAATGAAGASAYNVNPSQINASSINQYMSPYLQDVVGSEAALLNQNNQQQQSGQMGTAISSGAFGGDRSGIAAANLNQQQNLANANIYSGLLNTGYNNALSTAQQQQGVDLSAQQANRANLQNVAGLYANLGTGAQAASLQGAQAQLAAGQQEQQTAQAQDSALYNQFLQQQSYPFQTAQFLANIAEGTGVNSGSTTTTNTSQNGIFSDERLKQDIRPVGETFDGQHIYTYKYKGHPETHMGLMAQEVETKHPKAVGLAAGYKTVDYDKATDKAAERGHFAGGGLASGGMGGYAGGFDPGLAGQMLANYQAMYAPFMGAAGGLGAAGRVPAPTGGNYHLQAAQAAPIPQNDSLRQGAQDAEAIQSLYKSGKGLAQDIGSIGAGTRSAMDSSANLSGIIGGDATKDIGSSLYDDYSSLPDFKAGGRIGLAAGGDLPYVGDQTMRGMDIPEEQNNYKLQPAQTQGSSGPSSNPLGTIADVAKVAMMFAKRGGRIQRADGGQVDDGEDSGTTPESMAKALQALYDSENYQPEGLGAASLDGEPPVSSIGLSPPVGVSIKGSQGIVNGGGAKADRNNNPGNIEDGKFAQNMPGYAGSDGRFAIFESPEAGRNAQVHLLNSYLQKGYDTPLKIAARWAPAGDGNNNPAAYAQFIAKHLGIGAGDPITPDKLPQLAIAQGLQEGSHRVTFASGGLAGRHGYALDGGVDGSPENLLDGTQYDSSNDNGADSDLNSEFDSILPDKRKGLGAAVQDTTPLVGDTSGSALGLDAAMPVGDTAQGAPVPSEGGRGAAGADGAQPAIYGNTDQAPIKAIDPSEYMSKTPDYYGLGQVPAEGNFFDRLKHGKTDAVLSLLSGLSAMATAPTRNIGYALASGLGAGVQTLQQQREYERQNLQHAQELAQKSGQLGVEQYTAANQGAITPYMQAEIGARAGLTGVQAAQQASLTAPLVAKMVEEGKLTANQAQAIRAGLLDIQTLPNGNVILTDKGKIASGTPASSAITYAYTPAVQQFYGENGQPSPQGAPTLTQGAPKPGIPATAPSGGAKKGWAPTTAPSAVDPIPALWKSNDPRFSSILQGEQASAEQSMANLRNAAQGADTSSGILANMKRDFAALPASGILAPGGNAEARTSFIRKMNGYASVFGLPTVADTAGGEAIMKLSRQISAAAAQHFGSHTSNSVLNTMMAANPNLENSPHAVAFITSALDAENQRVRDRLGYYENWRANPTSYGTLRNAESRFEQENPAANYATLYARKAVASFAKNSDLNALHRAYGTPNWAKQAQAFDTQYGRGSANAFMGVR